jgi:hypothetical protein
MGNVSNLIAGIEGRVLSTLSQAATAHTAQSERSPRAIGTWLPDRPARYRLLQVVDVFPARVVRVTEECVFARETARAGVEQFIHCRRNLENGRAVCPGMQGHVVTRYIGGEKMFEHFFYGDDMFAVLVARARRDATQAL